MIIFVKCVKRKKLVYLVLLLITSIFSIRGKTRLFFFHFFIAFTKQLRHQYVPFLPNGAFKTFNNFALNNTDKKNNNFALNLIWACA